MSRLIMEQDQGRRNHSANLEFSVSEFNNRYVISPVQYRNGLYEVSWSKELLDGGNDHIQDEWLKLLHGSEWSLPSVQLYHATLAALYHEREGSNSMVQTLRNMFKDDFSKNWMITGTKIKYKARGSDKVIHELGSPEEYEIDLEITGPDGLVNRSSGYGDSIEALFGTNDLLEVETVFEWMSGKKPYVWQVNEKQSAVLALVLGVGNFDRFLIDAGGVIKNSRPARGVVSRKISKRSRGNKK